MFVDARQRWHKSGNFIVPTRRPASAIYGAKFDGRAIVARMSLPDALKQSAELLDYSADTRFISAGLARLRKAILSVTLNDQHDSESCSLRGLKLLAPGKCPEMSVSKAVSASHAS